MHACASCERLRPGETLKVVSNVGCCSLFRRLDTVAHNERFVEFTARYTPDLLTAHGHERCSRRRDYPSQVAAVRLENVVGRKFPPQADRAVRAAGPGQPTRWSFRW